MPVEVGEGLGLGLAPEARGWSLGWPASQGSASRHTKREVLALPSMGLETLDKARLLLEAKLLPL